MPSTYGARHGLVGYDRFRTGLCFATVSQMLRVESDDPSDWRQKSRGCVLGLWHSLKMALYGQSVDSMLGGPSVRKIQTGWNELVEKPVYGFVTSGDVRSVRLVDTNSAVCCFVIIHESTQDAGQWQASRFDNFGAVGHSTHKTLADALDDYDLRQCHEVAEVL
jgi:hypothetical protein